jgi:glucokinase
MASNIPTATGIILVAGTITFANEWYQTKNINWRVPLATIFAALIFDGVAHVNDRAATGLAIMVLLGAMVTRFNGKSVAGTLADTFNAKPQHAHSRRAA